MWLVSGLSILLYPKLMTHLNYSNLDFTNTSNLGSFNIILYFWMYLSALILSLKFIFFERKISTFFITNYAIFSLIFLILWFIGNKILAESMLIYYIFIAFGEEFAKYFLWLNFYEKMKQNKNDILIFCILSALGFAFVENIVYLVWWVSGSTIVLSIIGWTTILITRWVIWFLVHSIFTWNIWLFNYLWNLKDNFIVFITSWIFLWVWLHYIYNVMLYKNIKLVILLYMIIWYFWISYLFYKSDRIYIRDWLQTY